MIRPTFFPASGAVFTAVLTAVFVGLFTLCACRLQAQEHQYHFHYHPVNPDTAIRYLYDWYEIEPDGWMRRDLGMFKKELHDLYGTLEPENRPDGTAINLRVFRLEGELLDDRKFVCRDTTIIQFGPIQSDFHVEIQHEINPDATSYDNGYMFIVEDDKAVVEFFNLTEGKVRFEHGWFYWDHEEEAFRGGPGQSGRTDDRVIEIPVTPIFGSVVMHYFEFITAERDTVYFHANVAGDPVLGAHLLFEVRDCGAFVLGRVKPADSPR